MIPARSEQFTQRPHPVEDYFDGNEIRGNITMRINKINVPLSRHYLFIAGVTYQEVASAEELTSSISWELLLLRSILVIIVMCAASIIGISRLRHFLFLRIIRRSEIELSDARRDIGIGISYVAESGKMLRLMDAAVSFDEAVSIAGGVCKRLLPSQAGGLYIIDRQTHILGRHSVWGNSTLPTEINSEECWALRTGTVHLFILDETPKCAHFAHKKLQRAVCLPLRSQGELLGLIIAEEASSLEGDDVQRQLIANLIDWMALALRGVRTREDLLIQSVRDPLTELFNRRYLDETLLRELKRASRQTEPLSVILIDLDYFKRVNDTFGHDMGDFLLREVAAVLRKAVRDSDAAFRYGGEELTLVLPNCNLLHAYQRAEEIKRAISTINITLNGKSLSATTASFGVAAYPEHGDLPNQLIAAADKALYQAKSAGRNCVVAYDATKM